MFATSLGRAHRPCFVAQLPRSKRLPPARSRQSLSKRKPVPRAPQYQNSRAHPKNDGRSHDRPRYSRRAKRPAEHCEGSPTRWRGRLRGVARLPPACLRFWHNRPPHRWPPLRIDKVPAVLSIRDQRPRRAASRWCPGWKSRPRHHCSQGSSIWPRHHSWLLPVLSLRLGAGPERGNAFGDRQRGKCQRLRHGKLSPQGEATSSSATPQRPADVSLE